jgi:hypothetical protein
VIGVMTVQRRFGGVQEEGARGEYVALDTRAPPEVESRMRGETIATPP